MCPLNMACFSVLIFCHSLPSLEELEKNLAKKGWKRTTILKAAKEDINGLKYGHQTINDIVVTSRWVVLDAGPQEITFESNFAGFNFEYMKDESISFRRGTGKWDPQELVSSRRAKALPGKRSFVTMDNIKPGQRYLVYPVQKVYDIKAGGSHAILFGYVETCIFTFKDN